MSALIGILVDVSGSMKESIGGPVHQEGGSWARSIFKVVDELIKHDVSSGNQVFVIGYGAYTQPYTFDLLNTVKKALNSSQRNRGDKNTMLEKVLEILERNGAPFVREWAPMDILVDAVTHGEAELVLAMLTDEPDFRYQFVRDCLPEQCREKFTSLKSGALEAARYSKNTWIGGILGDMIPAAREGWDASTKESIREAINKGLELFWKFIEVSVSPSAIIGVKEASNILHGCIEENSLTKDQVDKLMKTVEPFIYGRTPMIEALNEARDLLDRPEYKNHSKVLFILSDGMPTDEGSLPDLARLDVNVVSCYITHRAISDPKRLYSNECHNWEEGAKFMFHLSSAISTQLLPRTIFVKRGWNIDIANNRTKLFFQVNHPDLIDDVCSLARDVVCSQEALSDLLASVSLDLYINQENERFGAQKQEHSTCYANASAVVLHLSMKRIVGREGGYPDFFKLRKKMIAKYGENGAITLNVLQEMCPQYRLHYQEIDIQGAMKAIAAKRPVLAQFWLTDQEWASFSKFYNRNRRGVLTVNDIDIRQRPPGASLGGHAVVLTSFNSDCLRFMNSWGTNWADNGFFRVRNADVLDVKFVDVYWTLNDLTTSEIEEYNRQGPQITEKLLTSLKGLHNATFKCPLCNQISKVTEFTGQLVRATCPRCRGVFDTNSHKMHDLVLNMYLTSLCQ